MKQRIFLCVCTALILFAGVSLPVAALQGPVILSSTSGASESSPLSITLLCIAIATVLALFFCLRLKNKMKTVQHAQQAQQYVSKHGLQLSICEDRFSHTTVSKKKK